MTETPIAAWLETLNAVARTASIAEQEHQKEAVRRAGELREARAFAWRRLNLVRAIAAAVAGAEGPEAVVAAGRAAVLRETGLSGATEAQREVADRFAPVTVAVAAAAAGEDADPASALADFEAWYAGARGVAFLSLMEREVPELPLVEV